MSDEEKKKTKVLITDDDTFLLDMYALKFKKSGFDVNIATNGMEAMNKIKGGFLANILLVDVVMPEMDGFELVEKIRNENLLPDAVIVMLTNQSQESDIEKAKKLKVHGYIVKASSVPSEVVAEVESIYKANS